MLWAACALLLTACAVLLASCAVGPPPAPPHPPAVPFDAASYRGFVVPRPLLPFHLQGAVQFRYRGEAQSGDMTLQALPGPAFRLELRAPLTGALALELRLADKRLLVIDYVNETWLAADNTPDVRMRLFDLDLTPDELLTLLTGRVGETRFAAGQGLLRPDGGEAEFRDGAARQRFRLDAHGLPSQWVKEEGGAQVFRVDYREYLEQPQPQGPPLRLPRKVRLSVGQGPARLVVGVREFQPGAADGVANDLERLPAGAAHFAQGALPEPGR
jgi:hypothetical protein